jgi:hypothetical protein
MACSEHFHGFVVSRTSRYMPARPSSRTAPSKATERWCNRSNSTRRGSVSAVFCTDTISLFSAAIRLLTVNCEAAVSNTINTTHSAAALVKLPKSCVRASRDARNTSPKAIPAKCNRPSANPTIIPAASRFPRIANAPGATTKLRNASAPSHRPKLKNSIVRKKVVTKGSPPAVLEQKLTANREYTENLV